MRAKCPNCQAAYSIKPEFIGKQTVCQSCGNIFSIYEDLPQTPSSPPMPKPSSNLGHEFPGTGQAEASPEPTPEAPPAKPTISARPARAAQDGQKAKVGSSEKAKTDPAPAKAGSPKFALGVLVVLVLALAGGGYFLFRELENARQSLASVNARLTNLASPKVREIAAERQKLAQLLEEETESLKSFQSGGPVHVLKTAIVSELRLTDSLLAQEAAVLESGAQTSVKGNKTTADPQQAQTIEAELVKLTEYINQRDSAKPGLNEESASALESELGTLHLIKAVLIRNYLTAKYGLNSPFINQDVKSVSAQASAAPPATAKTVAEAQPAQKILTVADVLGSNSEWKIQGPWATRLSGSGSGLSVRVLRLAAIGHAQVNGALQQASLFVTCQGNKTELYVNFGLPLDVDSNKVDMEYQIDDGAVAKETWNASVDQKGAFAPKPIVLLRAMLNANKIIFRTGYQNREVMGTIFFLDDLAEALKPVQSACNWK